MARVTVEDCVDKVENRFELVMVAAQRARQIGAGARLTIERDNDKNPVVALREIADETVGVPTLKEELLQSHQKIIESDEDDDSVIDLMDGEEEWARMASQGQIEDASATDDDDDSEDDAVPTLGDLAGVLSDDE